MVAIVVDGETRHLVGYGVADAVTGEPVTAEETTFMAGFMAGSVGKLVTYAAVLQGVKDRVLDLDEDVRAHLDDVDLGARGAGAGRRCPGPARPRTWPRS